MLECNSCLKLIKNLIASLNFIFYCISYYSNFIFEQLFDFNLVLYFKIKKSTGVNNMTFKKISSNNVAEHSLTRYILQDQSNLMVGNFIFFTFKSSTNE